MFCFAQTGPIVVYVDPTHAGVMISLKGDATAADYAEAYARQPGWTVVRVRYVPWTTINIRHLMNFVPSCVTVIKIVLGLPAPCLTPYGYYKYLLASGKGEKVYGRRTFRV